MYGEEEQICMLYFLLLHKVNSPQKVNYNIMSYKRYQNLYLVKNT